MKLVHRRLLLRSVACVCTIPVAISSLAQSSTNGTTTNQPPSTTEPQKGTTPAPGSHGQVLFQSHGEPGTPQSQPAPSTPSSTALPPLTDTDRAAVKITGYDLDIRITPATSTLTGRAKLTLSNGGESPLSRIALQISSTLTWQSATLESAQATIPLPIAQHHLDTDADHTGQASELIVTLPKPLIPGASLTLDTFYSGTIQANGGRLERLGASPTRALSTDWDAIAPDSIALRGFGNVLWYPVAAPQLFLSDGSLVPAVDKARLADTATGVHLRLSIAYTGDAPVAAYFCGRRQPLAALPDNSDAPVASGTGIATASFPTEPIGFRTLSLFVINQPETMIAPLPGADASIRRFGAKPLGSSSSTSEPGALSPGTRILAVETNDESSLAPLASSAEHIAPLFEDWFGPHPLSALTLIDHPGQPFEDGPLLVAPLAALATPASAPLLAHSLTHAWVQTGQPWVDEGLAEFFSLLWTEREKGRDEAVAQMDALLQPVVTAETSPAEKQTQVETSAAPNASTSSSSQDTETASSGQPLIDASDEIFYRRKAAAVWWMLRDIAGEQPLQLALSAWCTQPARHDSAEKQAQDFEALLEKVSGKDLGWFFDDWVLRDRGLPTLSIVDVTPRLLPAGTGHDSGWLVAVTMRNQGEAGVEVPLILRSGTFSVTKRIHIPGLSSVTYREVIQTAPTEVMLNDGSVPETGAMEHTLAIVAHPESP